MKPLKLEYLVLSLVMSQSAWGQNLPTIVNQTPVSSKRTQIVRTSDSATCQVDTKKLGYLKEFITCQSSPLLGACGALGAGIAGRAATNALFKDYEKWLRTQKEKFMTDMASELHDDWRKARKVVDQRTVIFTWGEALHKAENAIDNRFEMMVASDLLDDIIWKDKPDTVYYEPRIKIVDGVPYDIANMTYKDLPEFFQKENRESARVVYQEILKRVEAGLPLDDSFLESASDVVHKEWLKRNGDWASAEQKLPFSQLSKIEADKDRAMVRMGLKRLTTSMASEGTSPAIRRAAVAVLSTGAKRASSLAGKILFGGTLATDLAFLGLTYSPSTGCSSLTDSYLNAQGDSCEPTVGLSDGVVKFLELSKEDQDAFLKNSRYSEKFCGFYGDLYDKLLGHNIKRVSCNGKSAEVQMFDSKLGQYTSTVRFREGGRVVNVSSAFPGRQKDASVMHTFTNDGKDGPITGSGLGSERNEVISRTVQANKLFAHEVAACCSADTGAQLKCLAEFNNNRYNGNSGQKASDGVLE